MRGLSPKFNLVDGKLVLTGGAGKARDNLYFLMNFYGIRRIYASDFTPELEWLAQKPVSTVLLYKVLVLGKIRKSIAKYVDGISVDSMGVVYTYDERKKYEVYVDFTHKETQQQTALVTFV